jgi:anti-sigma B factor antagonist
VQGGGLAVQMVSGVPVVAAPTEIDISNAHALRTALLNASALQTGTLVVDMSRTEFCDSTGLNVLVRAYERARDDGGQLLLVIRASAVMRIFAVIGINRLMPIFADLEQALEHVQDPSDTALPEDTLIPEK